MNLKSKPINVYLASGWFNPTQKQIMEEIFNELNALELEGRVEYFAPFYNGIVLKRDDPREKWKEVFDLDVRKIKTSDLMVANIEGFEPGTIFEIGVAFALNVPVIAYSNVPGRGLNVMLAQSCIGFRNTPEALREAILQFIENPTERIDYWSGEPI